MQAGRPPPINTRARSRRGLGAPTQSRDIGPTRNCDHRAKVHASGGHVYPPSPSRGGKVKGRCFFFSPLTCLVSVQILCVAPFSLSLSLFSFSSPFFLESHSLSSAVLRRFSLSKENRSENSFYFHATLEVKISCFFQMKMKFFFR